MARRCEVREMRSAAAGLVIVREWSEKATGELIDTETVTISSEEGRWKRAARYLAGGLSYAYMVRRAGRARALSDPYPGIAARFARDACSHGCARKKSTTCCLKSLVNWCPAYSSLTWRWASSRNAAVKDAP